jgi:protease I
MSVKGQHVAILVERDYEDLELWYPYYRLKEAQADVVLVGPESGVIYPSKHGYPAKTHKKIDDMSAADVAAVIIPGGYSPDHMRRNARMVQFVKDCAERGKVVAAICHGGWMLCSAGVLKGKRATSYVSIKDDMTNAGAHWVDEEVVRDGTLITSRKPDDLPHFMTAVLEGLSLQKGR